MSGQSLKVLYVDDEEQNRVIFRATFEDEFEILCTPNGGAALAALERDKVAVVIADQRMPDMTGHELLSRVRERYPGLIRMVMTGYSDVDAILAAVNQGLVTRYVVKPWEEGELREMLRWGLQAHRLGAVDDIQARLLEAERLTTIGAIQMSFLHEIGRPLAHMALNAEDLGAIAEEVPALIGHLRGDVTIGDARKGELIKALGVLPDLASDLVEGSRMLTRLIEDVHALFHAEAPDAGGMSSCDEVRRAVDFCLAVNRVEASESHVELDYSGPLVPPAVQLDVAHLMQILINLTRNAIQAFETSDARGAVDIYIGVVGGMAEIVVADNGPGMSPDVLRKLGRQFYTTRAKGSGLGVFRCRTLLERSGGSLTYESSAGHGTRAVARVPLAPWIGDPA